MKIGIISTTGGYQWAGSEELWYLAALEAINDRNQVTALISSDMIGSTKISYLVARGGRIKKRKKYLHPRISAVAERFFPTYARMMKHQDVVLISAGSPLDIIFLPGLYEAVTECPVPIIILLQFNAEIMAFSSAARSKVKNLMSFSKSNIFVSRHNFHLMERQIGCALKNSRVIYNPVKIRLQVPLEYPSPGLVNFACVARLEIFWKGHDTLLEVLSSEVWTERSWHLNLYGVGPDQQYIVDLITFLKLEHRVTLHGQINDVIEIWSKNNIMLLASRGEGTPLAILESMMCGRPVVTTDVGGNREIVSENVNGWIAEASTSYSFGKVLEDAWFNRDKWQKMGLNAHEASRKLAEKNSPYLLLQEIYNTPAAK